MALHAIFSRRALTPQQEIADAVVLIDGEKIAAVGRRDEVAVPPSAHRHHKRDFTPVPRFLYVPIYPAPPHHVIEAKPGALAGHTAKGAPRRTTSHRATQLNPGRSDRFDGAYRCKLRGGYGGDIARCPACRARFQRHASLCAS